MPDSRPWRTKDTWAAIAFTMAAALILFGPVIRQGFGVKSRYFPDWAMFSVASQGYVVADFYTRTSGGELVEIDRFKTLGYKDRSKVPSWLKTIRKQQGLRRVTSQLCRRLDHGLWVDARITHKSGWRRLHDTDRNLCR